MSLNSVEPHQALASQPDGGVEKPVDLPATLTIKELNANLKLIHIDARGLLKLGFKQQARPGSGCHFLATDELRIRIAIAKHVMGLPLPQVDA